ncbi:hypothetical protein [Agromyces seonyuensis]|uniref:DNA mismatch repair protein n=1 Tax=Agromyces seonyuensis TaxID=2662446 RepID=A0A6I4NXX7_9MICO|nr:hypothetical protein [Agromyces seonyuensis]MWB97375.1 hypothetical protein [Agromyces seonyuensis]
MTTILDRERPRAVRRPVATPLDVAVRGLEFVPVARGLWRVMTDAGTIRGHIQRIASDGGERFEARRVRPDGASVPLGSFWSARDAVECFR